MSFFQGGMMEDREKELYSKFKKFMSFLSVSHHEGLRKKKKKNYNPKLKSSNVCFSFRVEGQRKVTIVQS